MKSSVTIKDVAREAAVSTVTVSRVFNNHPNVTGEVRQRVLKVAADLGYLGSKQYVSTLYKHFGTGRSAEPATTLKKAGFFFNLEGDLTSGPFWSHIMAGVESEANKNNICLLIRSISDLVQSPDLLLKKVKEMEVDGILLVSSPDVEAIHLFQATELPLVLVDTDAASEPVDAVLADYMGGAREAVASLISEGHRDIAFISSPAVDKIYTVELRRTGYLAALWNARLPFNEALYATGSPGSHVHLSLSVEGGYEACQQLLARNVPFSALFCANDQMAMGALKALRKAGRRVPEDVSVIGFDDIDLAEHLEPPLTTVRVNKEGIGSTALRTLIARTTNPQAEATVTALKVSLVKRASVAPYTH